MGDPTTPRDEAPVAAQTPDEFERQYMSAGGSVIHTRQAMPWWFFALLAIPVLAFTVAFVNSLRHPDRSPSPEAE